MISEKNFKYSGEEQREERDTEKNPDKRKERQVRKAQELPLLPLLSEQNDSIQVCKVQNTQLPTVLKETLQRLCRKLVTFPFCCRVDLRHNNTAQLAT